MRKLFIIIVAALATMMAVTSCNNTNKEGTYTFLRLHQYCTTQRADIEAYIAEKDPTLINGYQNERTGKYYDVCDLEIEDFLGRCNKLDSDYIKSKLSLSDDFYQIDLYVYNPLARLISVRWTNDGSLTVQE